MTEPGFELALWLQVQLMTLNYDILLFSTMLGCQHLSLGCWRTNGLDVFRKSKNDAFELWCWRRLLRVPWTARRSNQSILKEISPEYSLEGLMLKLKLQYFSHVMRRTDWLIGEDPHAGKDWRQEEKGMTEGVVGWHHWLNGYEFEQALGVGDGQEILAYCSPWGHRELDTAEWLNQTKLLSERKNIGIKKNPVHHFIITVPLQLKKFRWRIFR